MLYLLVAPAPAQIPTDVPASLPQVWISVACGLGTGVGPRFDGTAGLSLNLKVPARPLLAQLALNVNRSSREYSNTDVPFAAALSLSLGQATATDHGALAGFVGPSLSWGRNAPGAEVYKTLGLMGGAQFYVTPSWAWGLGMDVYVNLNARQSSLGVRFAFQLGSARKDG